VLARLAGFLGEEQGALETPGMGAVGMVELHGGVHGQTDGAEWSAIGQTSKRSLSTGYHTCAPSLTAGRRQGRVGLGGDRHARSQTRLSDRIDSSRS
jgi:hypothetical protein